MNIQVIPFANMCKKTDVKGKLVVVIDVLRATTVVTLALQNGAKSIIPLQSPEEVRTMRDKMNSTSVVTGGERHAVKIEDFDLGNSPEEYTVSAVNGKDILFTTTNGTTALLATEGAQEVILGCFLNMTSLAEKILSSRPGDRFYGPGHNGEIFAAPSGRTYMIYHCHDREVAPYKQDGYNPRPLFMQEIFWD